MVVDMTAINHYLRVERDAKAREEAQDPAKPYEGWSNKELEAELDARGVTFRRKQKKAYLINLLTEAENEPKNGGSESDGETGTEQKQSDEPEVRTDGEEEKAGEEEKEVGE